MSELMDDGIIRMPYEVAMSDELSRKQFYSRANSLLTELTEIRAKLVAMESRAAPADKPAVAVPDEEVAKMFHESYEKLAPSFGYETREETRKDWEEVPPNNKALMVAVIKQIRLALLTPSHSQQSADCSLVPNEVIRFLCGEGELDGLWFGERFNGMEKVNPFWWRKHLPKDTRQLDRCPSHESEGE